MAWPAPVKSGMMKGVIVMRKYDVFEGPEGRLEAVKVGFAWGWSGFDWAWKTKPDAKVTLLLLFSGIGVVAALIAVVFPTFASILLVPGKDFIALALWLLAVLSLPFSVYLQARVNGWRKKYLLDNGWTIIKEGVEAKTVEIAISSLRPEVVLDNQLVKKGLRLLDEGNMEEAGLMFERIIRERQDDKSLLDFAKRKLGEIKHSGSSP